MALEWFIAKTPKKKYTKLNEDELNQELQNVAEDPLERSEVKLQDGDKKGKVKYHFI